MGFSFFSAKDIQFEKVYPTIRSKDVIMLVAKWGNSLAIRLPSALVAALDLKEGEEVELHLIGEKSFEVAKQPNTAELLSRLRALRGRLPSDFYFDRLEAAEAR